ncbi:molybdate transport system substrate-binding protein [Sulfitobacter marinus]|uniref:Molybdate transport system substrate-binding protein n=1 Tax=Sulfitobacter marinus TaxID=394264 RepID=A0A1I6RRL8_9RHOB|nr:molybdate ABC transporter substrate-binding protein [Sulfitobacter marinus]SFS67332.1 molybdate transport system substrate-binding protein [Sulfitobacter marinus]
MLKKLLIILAFLGPFAAQAQTAQVTVFAAASLRGALDQVATDFGATVALSFGGSGTMARQVAAGAPADVVILANPIWMDWLVENGPTTQGAPIDLLGNSLVLIVPNSTSTAPDPANLTTFLGDGRLAMGQRNGVPAGIYAAEWLQATDQWNGLRDHLAETDNVRSALALVARGDAPLGVVYRTDALAEPDVRVVYEIPADLHSPITYPAAALTRAGAAFLAHLQTRESRAVFASYGFTPVTAP